MSVYLTPTFYATGPKNFANTLVSKIPVNRTDGKADVIGYFGQAVDWNKIIPPLMKFANRDTVKLVDNTGHLAAECTFEGCKRLVINPSSDNLKIDPIVFESNFMTNLFSKDMN